MPRAPLPTFVRVAALLCVLTGQVPARAATAVATATAPAVRTPEPVVIDGRPDDAIWHTAPIISDFIQFSPAWDRFYWPILLLLVAGLVQRATNFFRPEWNWLPPVTRLGINVIGLLLIYPIHLSAPYFTAASLGGPGAPAIARVFDALTWWVAVAGFSFFFLTQIALNGWMCVCHARFLQRQRKEQAS